MADNQDIIDAIRKKREKYDDDKYMEDLGKRILEYFLKIAEEFDFDHSRKFKDNVLNETLRITNLLDNIDNGKKPTDDDINEVLLFPDDPEDFEPNEESFKSLMEEIKLFKTYNQTEKKKLITERGKYTLSSILPPQNIKATNIKSDSITITWDKPEYECSYIVKLQSFFSNSTITEETSNLTFTFENLNPQTEYTISICAIPIVNKHINIWSDPIKIETSSIEFRQSSWKVCPPESGNLQRYVLESTNPKIARKTPFGDWCTIIGNAPIPPKSVTSWGIKVIKSRNDNGRGMILGVAPIDIDQHFGDNSERCGWYFGCFGSGLWAGPSKNNKDPVRGKPYGIRKDLPGDYVKNDFVVKMILDTTGSNGKLSITITDDKDNVADLSEAFNNIALDKPLVPCALLYFEDDAVELILN